MDVITYPPWDKLVQPLGTFFGHAPQNETYQTYIPENYDYIWLFLEMKYSINSKKSVTMS